MCGGQCPICIEDYSPPQLRRLACPQACGFACCRECIQRLCLQPRGLPGCPGCGAAFPMPWLVAHLDPAYVRTAFKQARRKQLVQQQLPLLGVAKRCRDCLQRQHEGACGPDDLASAGKLRELCQECPGCGALVEKVNDGACDIMHCVRCRTSFRFAGGTVVSNVLHNPDQDAAVARDVGVLPRRDIPCAYLFGDTERKEALIAPEIDRAFVSLVKTLQLMATHHFTGSTNAFSALRKQHEAGGVSERRWGALMYKRELANARNHEMANACGCAVETLMDVLANHTYMEEELRKKVGEVQALVGTRPSDEQRDTLALPVLLVMVLLPVTLQQVREAASAFNHRCEQLAGLYDMPTVLFIDSTLHLHERLTLTGRGGEEGRWSASSSSSTR